MKKTLRLNSLRRIAALFLGSASIFAISTRAADKNSDGHHDAFTVGSNENRVAQEVRHQLVTLPYYGIFDDMAFKVDGGTVTLLGQVTRPTLKSDAENVVKRIEGVTNVVNNIEVLPLSPDDDRIRMAAYRAIYGDSIIGPRYGIRSVPSIHIIVKNGQLRLEGVVANQGDKDLINIRAQGVSNAFSVTNDLQVEAKQ